MPRHGSEDIFDNDLDFYEEFIEKRGLNKITQYKTPKIPPLTAQVRRRFTPLKHVWKQGDKFYKLANEYYGDPKLWWVIAWYNQKPNEGMVKPGVVVFIPQPLQKVLTYFNYGTV